MRIMPVHHDYHLKRARGGSDKNVYRSERCVGGIGEDKEGSEPLVERDWGPYHISSLKSISGYRNKSSEIMHEAFAIKS